jgi:hypothetical protein
MSVVIFILGGWAASAAVMLAAIKPVTARMINDFAFIFFFPFNEGSWFNVQGSGLNGKLFVVQGSAPPLAKKTAG